MDIGDFLRIGIVLFLVYNLLFGKKKQEQKQEYEYPTFPEEEKPDVKNEEEKLRQWLEETFGGKQPSRQEAAQAKVYIEPEPKIEIEDKKEELPILPKIPMPANPKPNMQLKLGKIGKSQLAQAVLMKEILDAPRSKRPMNYYR